MSAAFRAAEAAVKRGSKSPKPRAKAKRKVKRKKGKAKKRKAPAASGEKRKLSPFILFSNAHRAAARAEHPELHITDIARLLGERWRALSDAEKKGWAAAEPPAPAAAASSSSGRGAAAAARAIEAAGREAAAEARERARRVLASAGGAELPLVKPKTEPLPGSDARAARARLMLAHVREIVRRVELEPVSYSLMRRKLEARMALPDRDLDSKAGKSEVKRATDQVVADFQERLDAVITNMESCVASSVARLDRGAGARMPAVEAVCRDLEREHDLTLMCLSAPDVIGDVAAAVHGLEGTGERKPPAAPAAASSSRKRPPPGDAAAPPPAAKRLALPAGASRQRQLPTIESLRNLHASTRKFGAASERKALVSLQRAQAEALPLLTDDDVRQLVPKLGHRRMLEDRIRRVCGA